MAPHAEAVDPDDDVISKVLMNDPDAVAHLDDIGNRELEVEDKADDAQDFEDISDDDLAEDDDGAAARGHLDELQDHNVQLDDDAPGHDPLFDDAGDGDDPFHDLFNAPAQSPPLASDHGETLESSDARRTKSSHLVDRASSGSPMADDLGDFPSPEPDTQLGLFEESDSEEDPIIREQRLLFEQSKKAIENRTKGPDSSLDFPPAFQTDEEIFAAVWPQFEKDKPPRFGQLIPPKKAKYVGKSPPKPPKPVQPTKVNLEIEPDDEKLFRLPEPPPLSHEDRQAEAEDRGLILTTLPEFHEQVEVEEEEEGKFNEVEEMGDVDGFTWNDIVAVCEDWTVPDVNSDNEGYKTGAGSNDVPPDDLFGDDPATDALEPLAKTQKLSEPRSGLLRDLHNFDTPIDNPEDSTSKLAKKVQLDMNDPYLLIDTQQPKQSTGQKRKFSSTLRRGPVGGLTRELGRRYNLSNDEAYDQLKENHQSKIRSTLGSSVVEHAMPAARLQYPFYKIKLSAKEARSFHRPLMLPEAGKIFFDKPRSFKRKHLKIKTTQAIFEKSEDVSQADNSNVLLLEHSEEYPAMMSNFGMGSRYINYYRRKDAEDTVRPRHDVGETGVLLPQDKSPFSIFGDVDPGQTVPTIDTGLYRAPIFKHTNSRSDFMLINNRTSSSGRRWFLKNIENLHVVGQQLPSMEVPGTHARKVTDNFRKRLKMLAYRIFNKHKRLKNEMVMKHVPGSDVAQVRSKLRDNMSHDKDRGWIPKETDVPDEAAIRTWMRPEELCLLESMQAGERQLQDAGYNKGGDESEGDSDEDENHHSLDQQLAPWNTTKNFLQACQGKAMLQLHGQGDPTGRGEGFSFLKTSMKGGFREIGQSAEDRIKAKSLRENNGHGFNVAKQQKAYSDAIRRIWSAQGESLSSNAEHDVEMEDAPEDVGSPEEANTPGGGGGGAFRSVREDETNSVFSRTSTGSQPGRVLRITRYSKDGSATQEIIRDPRVYRQYLKRRRAMELSGRDINEMRYTGNSELDDVQKKHLEKEAARLQRNLERRQAREKAKGGPSAASPNSGGSPAPDLDDDGQGENEERPSPAGKKGRKKQAEPTARKCAACGMQGHIKTNKAKCPVQQGANAANVDGAFDSFTGQIQPAANNTSAFGD